MSTDAIQDIYNSLSDANKTKADIFFNDLVFMQDVLKDLKADINKIGAIEHFINGKQDFLRENPALTSYNKLMKTYNTYYKNLIKLKDASNDDDFDDDFDDFLND